MKNIKKSLLFISAALIFVFSTQAVQAAPDSVIYFDPASVSTDNGETFNLEAVIDPGENLVYGADIYITFDPDELQITGVTEGDPPFGTILQAGTWNNTAGTASISVATGIVSPPEITSPTTVATFSFSVIGTASVSTVDFNETSTIAIATGELGNTLNDYTNSNIIIGADPVFRFWSNSKQGHFYTTSDTERDRIIANDPSWSYEKIACHSFLSSSNNPNLLPVFRFWSNSKQHHFYTISQTERDNIIDNDPSWTYEKIAFYAFTSQESATIPVYRFWSNSKQGHFYTTSDTERDRIIANDPSWSYEKIAWYVPAI